MPTNGLSGGIVYGTGPEVLGAMRSILREQRRQRLAVAVRIALAAAVAEPDVEVAVGAERQVAAVVVRERLVDLEDVAPRGRIGHVRAHGEAQDTGVAVRVGEVHVQEVAVRREHDPQQALFGAGRHLPGEIEDGPAEDLPVVDRDDASGLLRDVQVRVAGADRHGHRLLERRHQRQPDLDVGRAAPPARPSGTARPSSPTGSDADVGDETSRCTRPRGTPTPTRGSSPGGSASLHRTRVTTILRGHARPDPGSRVRRSRAEHAALRGVRRRRGRDVDRPDRRVRVRVLQARRHVRGARARGRPPAVPARHEAGRPVRAGDDHLDRPRGEAGHDRPGHLRRRRAGRRARRRPGRRGDAGARRDRQRVLHGGAAPRSCATCCRPSTAAPR